MMSMEQFMEIKKNFDENNLERIKKQYKMFLKEASEWKKMYEKCVSEEKWNLAMIFYCSYKQYDNYAETFKMYIDKAEENTERKKLMTKLTKAQFEEAKENIDRNNKKSVGMLYRDAKEEATEKKKEYNKYKNNNMMNAYGGGCYRKTTSRKASQTFRHHGRYGPAYRYMAHDERQLEAGKQQIEEFINTIGE